MNNFAALQRDLIKIDDPEIRARLRREYGLLGLDEMGKPGPLHRDGAGPQAALNAAAAGCVGVHPPEGGPPAPAETFSAVPSLRG